MAITNHLAFRCIHTTYHEFKYRKFDTTNSRCKYLILFDLWVLRYKCLYFLCVLWMSIDIWHSWTNVVNIDLIGTQIHRQTSRKIKYVCSVGIIVQKLANKKWEWSHLKHRTHGTQVMNITHTHKYIQMNTATLWLCLQNDEKEKKNSTSTQRVEHVRAFVWLYRH